MKIYDLYMDIFKNPFSAKNYRELELYYFKKAMPKEAEAFGKLVAQRSQNDNNTNSSRDDEGTRKDD